MEVIKETERERGGESRSGRGKRVRRIDIHTYLYMLGTCVYYTYEGLTSITAVSKGVLGRRE